MVRSVASDERHRNDIPKCVSGIRLNTSKTSITITSFQLSFCNLPGCMKPGKVWKRFFESEGESTNLPARVFAVNSCHVCKHVESVEESSDARLMNLCSSRILFLFAPWLHVFFVCCIRSCYGLSDFIHFILFPCLGLTCTLQTNLFLKCRIQNASQKSLPASVLNLLGP